MNWSRTRRVVQGVALVAFLGLTLAGLGWGASWVPGSVFSRLDPLVGLSSMVASRALIAFWAASLLTLGLTVAFGRAWCGWICPVGALVDLVPSRRRTGDDRLATRWRFGKFVVLVVVLGAAVLGSLGPMVLDPITIVTRPLQEIARPLFGGDAVSQSVGADIGRQAMHVVGLLSLLPLVALLALNAVDRRFWCRNLCPFGALLALVSIVPGIRRRVDADACISCGRCAKVCPTSAIERADGWNSSSAECITCMACIDECPSRADRFAPSPSLRIVPPYRPDRRDALIAIGAAGAGLALAVLPRVAEAAEVLRPPSTTEQRLAERCVRCGACYAMCPTGVLRPSISFTTVAGPWTPMLDERPAHCTLNCNRCATVCPTGALYTPTEDERVLWGLGAIASVDHDRCRAWRSNHECMACQSVCPIAGALVGTSRPENLPVPKGMPFRMPVSPGPPVQVPVVNASLCVGCNQCAGPCPMQPSAIRVQGDFDPAPLS